MPFTQQILPCRSGTEEQYGELENLLDDVTYLDDMQKENTKTKAGKQLVVEKNKKQADMFRDAAMNCMRDSKSILKIKVIPEGKCCHFHFEDDYDQN